MQRKGKNNSLSFPLPPLRIALEVADRFKKKKYTIALLSTNIKESPPPPPQTISRDAARCLFQSLSPLSLCLSASHNILLIILETQFSFANIVLNTA
jgi:hypothetical protein